MKEKLKNKKVIYTIIGIISVALVAIAITYAYWLVTKNQKGENFVSSACLDIDIIGEKNDIDLPNQFPISDEEGMKLVPYEFTVTNKCNISIDYQVNLEALDVADADELSASALKVALNDEISLLSDKAVVATTVDGAYESRKLLYGTLAAASDETTDDEVTYELRLWIDANASTDEMNKTFNSKITVTVGQGIFNPYKEGTMAYDVLAEYGGINNIESLSSDWTETIGAEKDQYVYYTNEYYWGTDITFDSATGRYSLDGTVVHATVDECRNGQLSDGTSISCNYTTLEYYNDTYDHYNPSKMAYKVTSLTGTKADTTSSRYIKVQEITSHNGFSQKLADGVSSVQRAKDDYGTSYYFRGDVDNNYVQFGSYAKGSKLKIYDYSTWSEKEITFEEDTPMYWRIVRINGDGTIRLVYDGYEKAENGTDKLTAQIGIGAYNTNDGDPKYVGYTYDDGTGKQVDSTIKGVLDAWYEDYLQPYETNIADSIFCNDKEIKKYEYLDEIYEPTTQENAKYTNYTYAPLVRFIAKSPSLECTRKEDRYTMDDTTNGNGYLKHPIGTITMDELLMAGYVEVTSNSVVGKNGETDNYLYTGNWDPWTMSPANASNPYVTVFLSSLSLSDNTSGIYVSWPEQSYRPVINLKADIVFEGDGSFETPYTIKTN